MKNQTLFQKLWDEHLVLDNDDGTALLYIDRHYLHEVTSPQAFDTLRDKGQGVWRSKNNLATADHMVPTQRGMDIFNDSVCDRQVETLADNCRQFNIPFFNVGDPRRGIVHVIGPQQGATLPGMSVVCGDSHTATHGAFAALSFGIGVSDVTHVLATQCFRVSKSKTMKVEINGAPTTGVTAKDIILAVIGRLGMGGAMGYAVEFTGSTVTAMDMASRMTLCNMAVEAGARTALIGVDEKTINYLCGKPMAPTGEMWEHACAHWRTLVSDPGAKFDKVYQLQTERIAPQVTWGTTPAMVADVDGSTPKSATGQSADVQSALEYMGLAPNTPLEEIPIDAVFIGSCTNGRIEDLRAAASVIKGKKIAGSVKLAMVSPGSEQVKRQAEQEGLDQVFIDAGFQWRDSSCSMCIAMNGDQLAPGMRCASTSNRNFEGRQGQRARTHLASPAMAAGAAVNGHFVDIRDITSQERN